MRKFTKFVPMELVLPERYSIKLHLNNDKSSLSVHEFYSEDTPQDIVDKTLEISKAIISSREGFTVRKISDTELLLEVVGSEYIVINSLLGEMDMLRSYLPSVSPVPQPKLLEK